MNRIRNLTFEFWLKAGVTPKIFFKNLYLLRLFKTYAFHELNFTENIVNPNLTLTLYNSPICENIPANASVFL